VFDEEELRDRGTGVGFELTTEEPLTDDDRVQQLDKCEKSPD